MKWETPLETWRRNRALAWQEVRRTRGDVVRLTPITAEPTFLNLVFGPLDAAVEIGDRPVYAYQVELHREDRRPGHTIKIVCEGESIDGSYDPQWDRRYE